MSRNRLYGIGEPVTRDVLLGRTTSELAMGIINDLGVTAMREWVNMAMYPELPEYDNNCKAFDKTLALCEKYDIEVTGMGTPTVPGVYDQDEFCGVPPRDLSKGSPYMEVLKATEANWERIARRFPYIRQWEVGNEWNYQLFLHPLGWKAGDPAFSIGEMMEIACDLMYVSARGVRKGNPEAKVVSFSPTPDAMHYYLPEGVPITYGIPVCLDMMYKTIESGKSFSTDSDDYFDMLAWHPYLSTQMGYEPYNTTYPATDIYLTDDMPDALWKSYNDMAYHVMTKHGDGHKKVLITEFGFSDCWNEEREKFQASLIPKCFELLKQMPYVKTCHFFRLFEEEKTNAGDNGLFTNESEGKFGVVRESFHDYEWREKARVLSKVYHEEI